MVTEVELKYVKASELDPEFKYRIAEMPGCEEFTRCFTCGSCVSVCPLYELDSDRYNPRRVIRLAVLGAKELVYRDEFVWLCSSHSTCAETCPQNVNIGQLCTALVRLAEREGYNKYGRKVGGESGSDRRVIRVTAADAKFKYEVMKQEGGEGLMHCLACGTCVARCPEREQGDEFNPRRVIRKVIFGLKSEVFSDEFIWRCSTHSRCKARCPQGVYISAVMNAIKTLAIKDGYTRPGLD